MQELSTSANGDLGITASENSSQNDFDFYIGKWEIRNRKLKTRLNECTDWEEFESNDHCYKILNGLGNIGQFSASFDGIPFEGMTLRLFNPITKLWNIYWADSNAAVLDVGQVGSFEGKAGRFYARDTFNGKPIIVLFNWDATDADNPIWSQAFSPDSGKTWEWNWYMYAKRIG